MLRAFPVMTIWPVVASWPILDLRGVHQRPAAAGHCDTSDAAAADGGGGGVVVDA